MIYAQIKNGVVDNTIVLNDTLLEPIFTEGFDALVRIDEMEPRPGIGWSYVDDIFIPPLEET